MQQLKSAPAAVCGSTGVANRAVFILLHLLLAEASDEIVAHCRQDH